MKKIDINLCDTSLSISEFYNENKDNVESYLIDEDYYQKIITLKWEGKKEDFGLCDDAEGGYHVAVKDRAHLAELLEISMETLIVDLVVGSL